MSTKVLKTKMGYADMSSRIYNINIDHIPNAQMNDFVTYATGRITAINTAAADQTSSVANTFISNDGAKFTGIVEAAVVITDEEILYNGG